LEVIKTLESNEFSSVKPETNPPTPTSIKLVPMNESSGSVRLLHMEIERLKEENEKLAQSVRETANKVAIVGFGVLTAVSLMIKFWDVKLWQWVCSNQHCKAS
jgi:predicted TIM-barrel fold metal-dependent hydrolase